MRFVLSALFLWSLFQGPAALATTTKSGCAERRDGRLVCPQPDARCMADRFGDILCSTPGGGIMVDRSGVLVCGPGHCTKDRRGEVFCSKSPRGAAATDRYGVATCTDECVAAAATACVMPKPQG